ncbi:MAG: LacI family DNA-binding transcriptional regulator [Phycisphaerales bacterium]|nr:LacI family DNA-binding transcriptional regulator [Phycisphaerales bacterium]
MSKGRASIRDVARESGVSLTTVSLILNKGDERISDSTRQRVLSAIEKLQYRPSRLARGLPNNRSRTLAVLIPALQHAFADPYFGEIISGIYDYAADHDYRIMLEVARRDFIRRKQYDILIEECSVDGILFIGATEEHRFLAEFDGSDKPFIVVNNHFQQWKLRTVLCDYAVAGRLAADHLVELGHRRVGHISGPAAQVLTAEQVTAAFVDRLAEHGVELPDRLIVDGQFTVEMGELAMQELLTRDSELTAVFCGNDKMALGAYHACRRVGRTPGEDIAIVGCDNIPAAQMADPPLTTIHMNFYQLGTLACRTMIDLVDPVRCRRRAADEQSSDDGHNGHPESRCPRLPVSLIARGSCCEPAVGDRV